MDRAGRQEREFNEDNSLGHYRLWQCHRGKSGPGFQKARNSNLVAVMRRNGDLARDYAQRHGVPKWYDDAQALINDPEVNADLRGDAAVFAQGVHDHGGSTLASQSMSKSRWP